MNHSATTVLRWGIAFVFFYAAVFALVAPNFWQQFVPSVLGRLIPGRIPLVIISLWQIFLAAWLFTGKRTGSAALAAIATFTAIVIANITVLDIVFPDVGLLFAALALYDLAKGKQDDL